MSKRSCGYWNCGYELRRNWVSKKFGFSEKKEAYEALRGWLSLSSKIILSKLESYFLGNR